MASIKYKDNGEYKDIVVKVGDTLPIGTEVDYEGAEVPNGWEEVSDPIGDLTTLNTANKTNVVSAINSMQLLAEYNLTATKGWKRIGYFNGMGTGDFSITAKGRGYDITILCSFIGFGQYVRKFIEQMQGHANDLYFTKVRLTAPNGGGYCYIELYQNVEQAKTLRVTANRYMTLTLYNSEHAGNDEGNTTEWNIT